MGSSLEWFAVMDINEMRLHSQQLIVHTIQGREICFSFINNSWHAFSNKCPHAGAPLCEGRVDMRGRIRCPLHGYAFNIINGHNTSGEGYKLKTYPVRIHNDKLQIELDIE